MYSTAAAAARISTICSSSLRYSNGAVLRTPIVLFSCAVSLSLVLWSFVCVRPSDNVIYVFVRCLWFSFWYSPVIVVPSFEQYYRDGWARACVCVVCTNMCMFLMDREVCVQPVCLLLTPRTRIRFQSSSKMHQRKTALASIQRNGARTHSDAWITHRCNVICRETKTTRTPNWPTTARLYRSIGDGVAYAASGPPETQPAIGQTKNHSRIDEKSTSHPTRKKKVYILLIDVSLDDLVISTRFGH